MNIIETNSNNKDSKMLTYELEGYIIHLVPGYKLFEDAKYIAEIIKRKWNQNTLIEKCTNNNGTIRFYVWRKVL